ncbi:unnamed protein product [Discosporangium mesarthrocarpum]
MRLPVWTWFVLGLSAISQAQLRPETDLQSNCFNFPEQSFDSSNCIKCKHGSSPHFMLDVGDQAVDFTLHDLDGQRWNLAEALRDGEKPVVLIWGMFSCPAYEGMGTDPPFDKASYWHERLLVEKFQDRATFVHLYGAEPHPLIPDKNFDSGSLLPNFWSTMRQPLTYDERADMARRVLSRTHPSQVLLLDSFPGNPHSDLIQPVWCTYGMGARMATVVGVDGRIVYQEEWLQTDHLAMAIDKYLGGDK